VADPPDILKYFYEEPALLEPVTPDADPDARRRNDRHDLPDNVSMPLGDLLDTRDAYRGYLAGTNRTEDTVGVTTLQEPDVYAVPILEALGGDWWARHRPEHPIEALDNEQARDVLANPGDTTVLVTADRPVDAERVAAVAGRDRRRSLTALRALLQRVHVVFFPEPAHDGFDWSFFSAAPMRESLVAAFRRRTDRTVRRFVIPYQKARSESKFYFERWQLTASSLPDYIEEV